MSVELIPGAENLILNPSVETNTTGHATAVDSGHTGSWVYTATGTMYAGSRARRFDLTASSVAESYSWTSPDYNNRTPIPEGGVPYVFSFRILISHPQMRARARIRWYDVSDAEVGVRTSGTFIALSTTKFDTVWFSAVAPATAVKAVCYAYIGNAIVGVTGTARFDGFHLYRGTTLQPYVDGSLGASYGWNGTAHASSSYRIATQATQQGGYGGAMRLTPTLRLADKLNNLGEEINIISGTVEMRTDAAVKMTFKGTTLDPDRVNPYTDYLAPFMKIEYENGTVVEQQLGLYSMAPTPETAFEFYSIGEIDAKDLTWNLSQASFAGKYSLPAGTNVVNAVIAILTAEGFTRVAIPASSKIFSVNRTWPIKASKLDIINDLLNAIGYYTLFSDRVGILSSFPYQDLKTVEPPLKLFSGQGSTVVGAIKKEPLTTGIVNFVKVSKEDTQNPANSIYWEQKNDNANSPASIPRMGRTIFESIESSDIPDLATAKIIAARVLQEAASLYTKYEVQTLPDPSRGVFEVYDTDIRQDSGRVVIQGLARCSGWNIGFTPATAIQTHYLNRLEDI